MKNHANNTIIQVFGLPGSGKTTLSTKLQRRLGCMWFNADKVRSTISLDLGFTEADRLKQATRMGQLCALVLEYEPTGLVIADFVNPTSTTRFEFNSSITYPTHLLRTRVDQAAHEQELPRTPHVFSIYMNTIHPGSSFYTDTAAKFKTPAAGSVDLEITAFPQSEEAELDLLRFIDATVRPRHGRSGKCPLFVEDRPQTWTFDGREVKACAT